MPSFRWAAAAAGCFLALSAAFQLPGLSGDGLLSNAFLIRERGLWAEEWPPATQLTPTTDYLGYMAPNASFIQEEIRAGRLPLWNPYIATGVPVVESGLPALFHPFTLLLTALPFEHALTVMAVVRLGVAGLGAFLLARLLGCGTAAAAAAGLIFMFSPLNLRTRFHPIPNAIMLLPFLLAVSELRARGGSARRLGSAWALLGSLVLLGGYGESSLFCLATAWAYHLIRAVNLAAVGQRWRRFRSDALFLTVCTCLAILGGAVLVFGHLGILFESSAIAVRSAFGYRGLSPSHLPSLLTTESSALWGYLGIAALLFAARGAASKGRFPRGALLLVGTLAVWATYGIWPLPTLLSSLPLVGTADYSRVVVVIHLCVALLAAAGVDGLDNRRAQWASIAAATGLALALVLLWASGRFAGTTTVLGTPSVLAQPAAVLGVAALLLAASQRWPARPAWRWFAVALLLADVYIAHGPRMRIGMAAYPPTPPALEVVRDSPEVGRAFIPVSLLPANAGVVYRTPRLAAYEPSLSARTTKLLQLAGLRSFLALATLTYELPGPAGQRILNLLNVRHVLARPPLRDPQHLSQLELVMTGTVAVYRNPHAFPRAFVANRALIAEDPSEALDLLTDPEIDLRQIVILEERPPLHPTVFPESPGTRARVVEYLPGDIRVDVEAPAGGYLVLSETFSQGWRVSVDGDSVRAMRGDYDLIVVPLWHGRHEVRFRYLPRSVLIGGVTSAVTLAALLGSLGVPSRRASAEPSSLA